MSSIPDGRYSGEQFCESEPFARSALDSFSEGRRMQRLAEALLRLSRVGWDLREPDRMVVDLRAAGQRAAELVEPLAESAGLRLSVEGEKAHVRADPEWLQEVLLVLLSNAVKNSTRGGDIRLRATTARERQHRQSRRRGSGNKLGRPSSRFRALLSGKGKLGRFRPGASDMQGAHRADGRQYLHSLPRRDRHSGRG